MQKECEPSKATVIVKIDKLVGRKFTWCNTLICSFLGGDTRKGEDVRESTEWVGFYVYLRSNCEKALTHKCILWIYIVNRSPYIYLIFYGLLLILLFHLVLQDRQCSEVWLVLCRLPGKFIYFLTVLPYSALILWNAHFLFSFSVNSCTLAFAFLLQLLHQLSSKENLSRELLIISWKKFTVHNEFLIIINLLYYCVGLDRMFSMVLT
jgi:hypothetical protein